MFRIKPYGHIFGRNLVSLERDGNYVNKVKTASLKITVSDRTETSLVTISLKVLLTFYVVCLIRESTAVSLGSQITWGFRRRALASVTIALAGLLTSRHLY